jgi:preprotein translocase subunit Sss1
MAKFDKWLLFEAAYGQNMGIIEMIAFYKKASNSQVKQMEKAAKKKDWDEFKKIIKEVIGVDLV